jgi:hypothetical protein
MSILETPKMVGVGPLISLVKIDWFYYLPPTTSEESFIKDFSID